MIYDIFSLYEKYFERVLSFPISTLHSYSFSILQNSL